MKVSVRVKILNLCTGVPVLSRRSYKIVRHLSMHTITVIN
jgi:hypothetical protein